MPASRWVRNRGSWKLSLVWPMALYQDRRRRTPGTRRSGGRPPSRRRCRSTRRRWPAPGPGHAGWRGSRTTRRCVPIAAAASRPGRRPGGGQDGGPLDGRVAPEPGADQPAVPGPVVLGVGGPVHPDPAVPAVEISLQGGLLARVEQVPGGRQEHHRPVPGQPRADAGRVGGVVDREPVPASEAPDGRHPVLDGGMPEPGRPGEHQHREPRRGGAAGGGRGRRRPGWPPVPPAAGASEGQRDHGQRGRRPPRPAG